VSRRFFLSAAAAAPAVPALVASDRIAIFDPPPERIRIVTVPTSYAAPAAVFTPEDVRTMQSQGKSIEMTVTTSKDHLLQVLPEADVVFGAITPDLFPKARNLRWQQHTEAGVDTILFPELVKSPIVVTNMARMFAPGISETAISMLLALTRGLSKFYIPQFGKHQWNSERNLVEVDGLTMGLVGMGGIGQAVATRAHYGFGMKILATDAKPMPKPMFVDTLREPDWFMEMVPQVDILVGAAPLTKDTRHMFNEKVFRSMKKTAYFMGLSRGGLTDQTALVPALKEGWIAGAGLDVTDPEPLPPNHPLWECPNLVITAHSAGFSPERRVRQMGLIADNVRRYAHGFPLLNVVDKERGY
jgi:phosphoglycerate dehydrogenase-like enzyme